MVIFLLQISVILKFANYRRHSLEYSNWIKMSVILGIYTKIFEFSTPLKSKFRNVTINIVPIPNKFSGKQLLEHFRQCGCYRVSSDHPVWLRLL